MRRREPARVCGPYEEKRGWRVLQFDEAGRKTHWVQTQKEAERLKKALVRMLKLSEPRPIAGYLDEWLAVKVRAGRCTDETARTERARLRTFFGERLGADVVRFTAMQAEQTYREYVERPVRRGWLPSAATHRAMLKSARSFFKWTVDAGHRRENPFARVMPVGRVNVGKTQLRLDEARRFVAAALTMYELRGNALAVGAVAALLLGLRASEVLNRVARDVDDGGKILWVDHGKTRSARRHLEVPEPLRPYLLRLAADLGPEDWLFGANPRGATHLRQNLLNAVHRICAAARVPRVCTHSLRGLYATLAVQSGAVSHMVAASLGHASFQITARHYAQPSAIDNATTARVLGAFGVRKEAEPPN